MKKRCWKQVAIEVKPTLESSKRKHLSESNVIDIIKIWGIRSETELLGLGNERADDDVDDLKNFIACT